MKLASLPTLLLALALAGPALWRGFVTHDLEPNTALVRLLLAIPLAGLMLAVLRFLTTSYRRPGSDDEQPPLRVPSVVGEPMPQRRSGDAPDPAAGPAAGPN